MIFADGVPDLSGNIVGSYCEAVPTRCLPVYWSGLTCDSVA
jgi:hypothetical protein